MALHIAHGSQFDFKKDLYEPLASATELRGYELIFPHAKSTEPRHSRPLIQSAKAVIAEVFYLSIGIGIELA